MRNECVSAVNHVIQPETSASVSVTADQKRHMIFSTRTLRFANRFPSSTTDCGR